MVVGGQTVQKGEPIARLVSIDAELVLEQSKNALAIREGELNRAKAELSAARTAITPASVRSNAVGNPANTRLYRLARSKRPWLTKYDPSHEIRGFATRSFARRWRHSTRQKGVGVPTDSANASTDS